LAVRAYKNKEQPKHFRNLPSKNERKKLKTLRQEKKKKREREKERKTSSSSPLSLSPSLSSVARLFFPLTSLGEQETLKIHKTK
jgi:hypothetical protein